MINFAMAIELAEADSYCVCGFCDGCKEERRAYYGSYCDCVGFCRCQDLLPADEVALDLADEEALMAPGFGLDVGQDNLRFRPTLGRMFLGC